MECWSIGMLVFEGIFSLVDTFNLYVGTLVSKIFENQIIMANTRHPQPRHARESGHPEDMGLSSRAWIPAFAGMTKSGYLVTGAPHAISLLAFETQTIRFWTRVMSGCFSSLQHNPVFPEPIIPSFQYSIILPHSGMSEAI